MRTLLILLLALSSPSAFSVTYESYKSDEKDQSCYSSERSLRSFDDYGNPTGPVNALVFQEDSMQSFKLLKPVVVARGSVPAGIYKPGVNYQSMMPWWGDCEPNGIDFFLGEYDEVWDREYKRTKLVLWVSCSDEVENFSYQLAAGYCFKSK